MKWIGECLYICLGFFFKLYNQFFKFCSPKSLCQMPEKQFRIVFLKESLFCPELGLTFSLLLLFLLTSDTPVTDLNHTGTKHSPAINLRSKTLPQYLIVNGKVTCILPTPGHTNNSIYEVKISFFKHLFYGCFISYVHVCMNSTAKSPGEEFLNTQEFSKNLKTLQSTLCNA